MGSLGFSAPTLIVGGVAVGIPPALKVEVNSIQGIVLDELGHVLDGLVQTRIGIAAAHGSEQVQKAVVGCASQSDRNVGPRFVSVSDHRSDDFGDRLGGGRVQLAKIFRIKLQKGDDPVSDVLIDRRVVVVQVGPPGRKIADDLGRLGSAMGSLVIELVVERPTRIGAGLFAGPVGGAEDVTLVLDHVAGVVAGVFKLPFDNVWVVFGVACKKR